MQAHQRNGINGKCRSMDRSRGTRKHGHHGQMPAHKSIGKRNTMDRRMPTIRQIPSVDESTEAMRIVGAPRSKLRENLSHCMWVTAVGWQWRGGICGGGGAGGGGSNGC